MTKTEIILREGNIVVRDTTILETQLGQQAHLFAKYLPAADVRIENVGNVMWDKEKKIPYHYAEHGKSTYLVCTLPYAIATPYYQTLGKDLDQPKQLLAEFLRTHPGPGLIQKKVKAILPDRKIQFILRVIKDGVDSQEYIGHGVQVYVYKKEAAYALLAPNHYRDGRVCMGNGRWGVNDIGQGFKTMAETLQQALNSYATSLSNTDLNEDRFSTAWDIDGKTKEWLGTGYKETIQDIISTSLLAAVKTLP